MIASILAKILPAAPEAPADLAGLVRLAHETRAKIRELRNRADDADRDAEAARSEHIALVAAAALAGSGEPAAPVIDDARAKGWRLAADHLEGTLPSDARLMEALRLELDRRGSEERGRHAAIAKAHRTLAHRHGITDPDRIGRSLWPLLDPSAAVADARRLVDLAADAAHDRNEFYRRALPSFDTAFMPDPAALGMEG